MEWESYEGYLASEEWGKLRNIVLRRAGNRCQACNADAHLQVHHRVYSSKWGEESTDDLIALCNSCHMLFHRNEKRIRKVNKLEKKIKNIKASEAAKAAKKLKLEIEADPYRQETVRKSSPVKIFSKKEICAYESTQR